MRTRPLMRTMEFQWHEAHWAEEDVEAAQAHARAALEAYARFLSEQAAIPAIYGEKTQLERFAGAQTTLTAEARMIDGKALQCATSHVMDEGFAAAYGIQYTGKGGTQNTPVTGSWGMSTRIIGAIVMTHADEAGMVMPPRLAPVQAVVMTAGFREGLDEEARQVVEALKRDLESMNLRVQLDLRDERIGAKHFKWEKEGVPLRIVVGPREVKAGQAVVVRRDDSSQQTVSFEGAGAFVKKTLNTVHMDMFQRAQERLWSSTRRIETLEDFEDEISKVENAFVLAGWSDTPDAERLLKERYGYTVRCIPDEQSMDVSRCFLTGEPATKAALIAKSY
jgi:prolyl-tRNA synthetase